MGGSTQTSTSQQHSETQPWAPAIPGLQQVLGDATTLYNSGAGTGIYSGPRVAQLGDDTLGGLQSIRDQFSSDNAAPQGISFAQSLLGSRGMSPTTQQGLGMLADVSGVTPQSVLGQSGLDKNGLSAGSVGALSQLGNVPGVDLSRLGSLADSLGSASNPVNQTATSFMNGSRDLTTIPQLQDLYAKSQAPSSAEMNLSGVARGDFLDPTKNAIFQNLVKTSSDNALQAQKEAFAASGRYGTGAFAGAATKAVNDTQSQLYAGQYNQERANQVSANSQIDSARQAASQLGSGILGQIGSVEGTNNQQRLSGAGLAQSQTAQQAGVLGQMLSGGEFNSSLGMQQAQSALGAYAQGTQNRLGVLTTDVGNDLNSQQFNSNLDVTKANGFINAGQTGQAQALQAATALPALDAARYAPAQQLIGVGSLLQGQDQANIGASQQLFDETNNMPWQNLDRYAGLMGGMAGLGGTTDSYGKQTTKTQQSLGSSLLGGALGIGGLVSKLAGSGLF
ncbi:hypothetical protein ABIE45_002774 [Methylobacterium sp. OAE515]|uniref:hypothetical protein n=1 Tax=Methylobacterium sp. OAE515 TaxID=2817895 RepID=UPI00178A9E96